MKSQVSACGMLRQGRDICARFGVSLADLVWLNGRNGYEWQNWLRVYKSGYEYTG